MLLAKTLNHELLILNSHDLYRNVREIGTAFHIFHIRIIITIKKKNVMSENK